jgi:hypothetical protein
MPLELVVPKIVSTSKGDCGCERWVCAAASLTASTVVPSSRAPSDVDPPKRHTHLPHSGPSSPPKCHSLPATEHLPFIDRAPPTDLSSSTNIVSHPPPPRLCAIPSLRCSPATTWRDPVRPRRMGGGKRIHGNGMRGGKMRDLHGGADPSRCLNRDAPPCNFCIHNAFQSLTTTKCL